MNDLNYADLVLIRRYRGGGHVTDAQGRELRPAGRVLGMHFAATKQHHPEIPAGPKWYYEGPARVESYDTVRGGRADAVSADEGELLVQWVAGDPFQFTQWLVMKPAACNVTCGMWEARLNHGRGSSFFETEAAALAWAGWTPGGDRACGDVLGPDGEHSTERCAECEAAEAAVRATWNDRAAE